MVKGPAPLSPPPARQASPAAPTSERDRLARPQPPAAIPPRTPAAPTPPAGLLAYSLLGAQVIK